MLKRIRIMPPRAAILALLAALGLAVAVAAPASAATTTSQTTYDRPSMVVAGGAQYVSWAGSNAAGSVSIANVDDYTSDISNVYVDGASSTAYGTGTALGDSSTLGHVVVAWTDSSHTVHVAAYVGGGLVCESEGFGTSYDTPYLASQGWDGNGPLYLAWVDGSSKIHIAEVGVNDCSGSGGSLYPATSVTIASNTSWDGPALAYDESDGGWWLTWAGTDSTHTLNFAEFVPGSSTLTNKIVETGKAADTDMSAAFDGQYLYVTYCGTNNDIYVQWFDGSTLTQSGLSGNCYSKEDVYGYWDGGVAVDYDYSNAALYYSYPNESNYALEFSQLD